MLLSDILVSQAPLHSANPIKVDQKTGQFYVAACFMNAGFYKLHPEQGGRSRLEMVPGGDKLMMNSFEIGDGLEGRPKDGLIYGPDIATFKIVTLDPRTGAVRPFASIGPFAWGVAFDSKGQLYNKENRGANMKMLDSTLRPGASMGLDGTSMGINGRRWASMGIDGRRWRADERRWASMGVDGASMSVDGASMGVDGASMGVDGASMGVDGRRCSVEDAHRRSMDAHRCSSTLIDAHRRPSMPIDAHRRPLEVRQGSMS